MKGLPSSAIDCQQEKRNRLHWPVRPIQPIIPFPVVILWPNRVLWKGKMRTFQAVNTYYNTMLSLARLLDHPSGRLHLPEFNHGGERRQEEIKERQSCKVSLIECNLWRMKTSGTLMMVIDCKILFQIVRVAYCRMSPARKEIIS